MIWPVPYDTKSQSFGENPTKYLPASHWIIRQFGNYQPDGHTGMDFAVKAGTPFRACADGTVIHVGWYPGTYADNDMWIAPGFAGFCYVVDHAWGRSIYGHGLDGGAKVCVGDQVKEGQVLGLTGNTGGSTGDHLHFEILLNGWVVNSQFYGRVNPEAVISTLAPAGEVITYTPDEQFFIDLSISLP